MSLLLLLLVFLLGSSIGSYIGGRTYRIIAGEDTNGWGRSYCPTCSHTLRPLELIPILSYLVLRGKSSCCHKPIAPNYIIIETLTGLAFVLSLYFPQTLPLLSQETVSLTDISSLLALLSHWIVISLLIYISVIDLKLKAFPVQGLLWGSAFIFLLKGGISIMSSDPFIILGSLLGGLGYVGVLYLIKLIGSWIYKKDVLGDGDLYLALCIGIGLGFKASIVAFYITIIIGGLAGALLLLTKKAKKQDTLPFGPLMALGALVSLFWSQLFLDWYMQFAHLSP